MKKINKYKIISMLSFAFIPISAVILTSCTGNKAATILESNTFKIHYHTLNQDILSKTVVEWQNEFSNNNLEPFIEGIKKIDNQYSQTGFIIDRNTTATINIINTPSSSTIFTNAKAVFKNKSEILEIYLDNLFIFPPANIVHPNLDLVKNPIEIDQISIPVIFNTDPTLVLESEWFNYLNSISPSGTQYIPNNLYYLDTKKFISEKIYQIIFKINDQYLPMINPDNFPNIIFNINVSPNIDKTYVSDFVLSPQEVQTYFPNLDSSAILKLSEIDIFNKLDNYVKGLNGVQQLVDCIDPATNNLYNYFIIYEPLTNSMIIKFSSNPDTIENTINFYSFRLNF